MIRTILTTVIWHILSSLKIQGVPFRLLKYHSSDPYVIHNLPFSSKIWIIIWFYTMEICFAVAYNHKTWHTYLKWLHYSTVKWLQYFSVTEVLFFFLARTIKSDIFILQYEKLKGTSRSTVGKNALPFHDRKETKTLIHENKAEPERLGLPVMVWPNSYWNEEGKYCDCNSA